MSSTTAVHLHGHDQWSVQDLTKYPDSFVALEVHGVTTLYVTLNSIDALIAAAEEAKTMLDKAEKKEPS